jgi:hypothetical protein
MSTGGAITSRRVLWNRLKSRFGAAAFAGGITDDSEVDRRQAELSVSIRVSESGLLPDRQLELAGTMKR